MSSLRAALAWTTAVTAAASAAIGWLCAVSAPDTTSFIWCAMPTALFCGALAAALAWGRMGSALGCLRTLTQCINARDPTNLKQGLSMPVAPCELVPVITSVDRLLVSTGAVMTREKSFTSSVAHELRTPLSGMRSTIEVALSDGGAGNDREAMTTCLAICQQLQRMVENLLFLSRLDSGQIRPRNEPVDLPGLISSAWSPHQERARQRRLRLFWAIEPMEAVQSAPDLLRVVVGNLLDNAVSYANEAGDITVACCLVEGRAILVVSNSGSTLGADAIPHLCHRFWRGKASEGSGNHSGLGLAICHDVVSLLGGILRIETSQGGRFVVRLEISGTGGLLAGA